MSGWEGVVEMVGVRMLVLGTAVATGALTGTVVATYGRAVRLLRQVQAVRAPGCELPGQWSARLEHAE